MTGQQQKFYWSAILPALAEGLSRPDIPVSTKEAHDFCKRTFLGKAIDLTSGEVLERLASTMTLTTRGACDYFDAIEDYFRVLGIAFPKPTDVHQMEAACP